MASTVIISEYVGMSTKSREVQTTLGQDRLKRRHITKQPRQECDIWVNGMFK